MIAKLVVWSDDRSSALIKLQSRLREYNVRQSCCDIVIWLNNNIIITIIIIKITFQSFDRSDRGAQHERPVPRRPGGPQGFPGGQGSHGLHRPAPRRALPPKNSERSRRQLGCPGIPVARAETNEKRGVAVVRRSFLKLN